MICADSKAGLRDPWLYYFGGIAAWTVAAHRARMMKNTARMLVCGMAITTVVAGFPRDAKAESLGTDLLIAGIAGAVIGGIVGLTQLTPAKSAPKPSGATPSAAQHVPSWQQVRVSDGAPERPWLHGYVFTF
jgi:hypothetical protein